MRCAEAVACSTLTPAPNRPMTFSHRAPVPQRSSSMLRRIGHQRRLHRERNPDVGWMADGMSREPLPRDTHHFVADPVQINRLREHIRRAAEPALPECVADHRDRRSPWRGGVCVGQRSPERHVDTHHLKVVAGHEADADVSRLVVAPQRRSCDLTSELAATSKSASGESRHREKRRVGPAAPGRAVARSKRRPAAPGREPAVLEA